MSATSSRTRHPGHVVTAVVLCHNNAKLLAKTLDALEAQVRIADRVVAVDMGSSDRSVTVAVDRLGADNVVRFDGPVDTSSAVAAGLGLVTARTERRARDDAPLEWIWLLHDDSAPDSAALDELLLRITHSPSVWLAGPKVRDWDNKLLLRAGVTIDAAGNVDTGLDRREPDQGQRDDVDEVLAVGIAGALVRRDVWEQLGGLDPAWADYASEIDLGWRVNAAGGRVVVVPHAVLLHGTDCPGDEPPGTAIRSQAIRRRNGMQIVLTNTAGWLVPLLLLRYLVIGVLHAAALVVLSRRPREAAAELLAVGQVFAAPAVILTGRRQRQVGREASYGDLRRLFPPAGRWLSGMLSVRMHSPTATDAPINRKRRVAVETGPVSEESEALGDELSAFGEFLRRPASLLLIVTGLLALVADRHVLSGTLHGGRLLPAPSGASDLWSSYFTAWHASSVGSVAPAPTSTALLAVLSTVLFGKAWLAIDVLFLGVVPLAAVSAFTALRVFTTAVRVRVWVSIVYALLPAVTGAAASGRIDVVVTAIVLPRVARAMFLAWHPDAVGTMRGRCVRAGLWLAVAAAFAPLIWLVAAVVCGAVLAAGYFLPNQDPDLSAGEDLGEVAPILDRLGAAGAILAVPLLVLLPWSLHVIAHPGLLFSGTGTQEFYAARSAPSGLSLGLLHAGGSGEPPVWVGLPIVAAIVLGLRRASRLTAARVGAGVFALGLIIAVIETRGAGVTGGYPSTRHWPGVALLLAGAGALLAALVAAVGARPALRDQSFSWRQPAAVVVVALALVSTVTLVGGWLVRGGGHPLRGGDPSALPVYVQAELDVPVGGRALMLNGDGHLVRYALVRTSGGPRLGAGDLPVEGDSAQHASTALADAVRDLVAGRAGAGAELVPLGVEYVVAPTATARHVAPELGQEPTLTVIPVPGATVWHSTLATGELTVLTGTNIATAEAGEVPRAAPAAVLKTAGGPASPSASVVPAAAPRLLVMAEPASSHWRASVDGRALTSKTAYGWAQAFELPPSGGQVLISYDSGGRHWWLLIELVLLAGVVLYGAGAGPHGAAPGVDMRRDVPIFAAAVVVALVISLTTGSTAVRRTSRSAGTAPVTARTLVCPAVNGLPRHTTATAVAADVGGALSSLSPAPASASEGTVTSSVLNGLKKSPTTAMHLAPTAEVHSKDLQSASVAITGNGSIAANLAADEMSETVSGRYRALAGGNCLPPATDWWFAGGNGKLGFTDRLILANPAGTDADVGVTVWTPHGIDAPPRFAAIRVPAESRLSIGLLAVAPDISTLAMHVHAESGAVVAAVVDRRTSGLDSDGGDLVPATLPPSRHPVVAGFPAGSGTRTLVLANPGAADASVSVKVVTSQGEFTPSSVKPVVVGPGRSSVVDMSKAFDGDGGAVLVSSDQPILAEGRTILIPSGRKLRPDLAWAAATHPLSGPAGVAIGHEPDGGRCVLVLSAPEGAGSVRVTTPTGGTQTITITAGHSVSVDITTTVSAGSGRWPFVVTPIGSAPVYGARQLYFSGAHGALVTTEPLIALPRPIPLPTVRQDPRIAVR